MKHAAFYQDIVQKHTKRINEAIVKKSKNQKKSRDYSFSHSVAAEALEALDTINEKYNIKIFLIDGGLLGLVREGTLLAHDYDLDMGFYLSDHTIEELKEIFEAEENFSYLSDSNDSVFISYKNLQIDLFGFRDIDDSNVIITTDIHGWIHEKFALKKVEFMQTHVLIPDPPETYLTNNYGDWKNKKLAYDFSYDTPNRVYNGLPGVIYLLNRLENAVKNGWDSYASMAVSALYRNYNIDYRHIFAIPVAKHPADSIKNESTIYVTDSHTFTTDLLKKLKLHDDPEKNLIIVIAGEVKKTQKLQKILVKLSFVTQVFTQEVFTEEIINRLYPKNKVVKDA